MAGRKRFTRSARKGAPPAARALPRLGAWHYAAFLVVPLVVTLPLLVRMKSAVWGFFGKGDLQMWFWYYWWEKKLAAFFWAESAGTPGGVIAHGLSFVQRFLAIPFTCNDTANILDRTIVTPLFEWLLPFPLYYNVKALLVFAAAALAFYHLARYLAEDNLAPYLGALFFAFSPYALFEMAMGRPMQTWVFTLPLYVLFLLRALRGGGWRCWLAAGLLLGLASVTYWYFGVFLVLLTAVLTPFELSAGGRGAARRLAGFLLLGVVAAALALPFLWPAFAKMGGGEGVPGVAFLTPFPSFGELAAGQYNRWQYWVIQESCNLESFLAPRGDFFSPHIPWVLAAGALAGLFVLGRSALPWAAGAFFFWLLTLGPYLKIGGRLVGFETGSLVPLPYQLFYQFFPFFTRFQWPSRFMSVVYLCLAALAAMGLAALFRNLRVKPSAQAAAVALAGALFLGELLLRGMLPVPVTPLDIPAAYRIVRSDPGAKVVVMPLGYEGSHIPHAKNWYQSWHGRKILDGAAQYAAPGWEPDGFQGNSFYTFLQALSVYPLPASPSFSKGDLDAVRNAGYRYLVLHSSFCVEMHHDRWREIYGEMNRMLTEKLGKPLVEDGEATLYRL